MRKHRCTGFPSVASNSMPRVDRANRTARSATIVERPWGIAIPFPMPVLPRASRWRKTSRTAPAWRATFCSARWATISSRAGNFFLLFSSAIKRVGRRCNSRCAPVLRSANGAVGIASWESTLEFVASAVTPIINATQPKGFSQVCSCGRADRTKVLGRTRQEIGRFSRKFMRRSVELPRPASEIALRHPRHAACLSPIGR